MNSKTTAPAKKKGGKDQSAAQVPQVVTETIAQKRSRIQDELHSKPRVQLTPVYVSYNLII